eukprot:13368160-Ditylum_brightwellii.AAC.1
MTWKAMGDLNRHKKLPELHLHEQEKGGSTGSTINKSSVKLLNKSILPPSMANNALLQQFLLANVWCTDLKSILCNLILHGINAAECTRYAALSGDIGTAVKARFGQM